MASRKPNLKKTWDSAAAQRLMASTNSASLAEAIHRVVEQLLDGVTCPPTDLVGVARKVNVTDVLAEDFPIAGETSIAGALRQRGDSFVVVYSSYLSRERRRFTICHELAHAYFEGTGPNVPRTGRELERLCNMIATELLLPSDTLRAHAGTMLNLDGIVELARRFQVSLTSTVIRLHEFFGVSAFLMDGEELAWSVGSIRHVPPEIMVHLKRVLDGTCLDEDVLLYEGEIGRVWRLEGRHLGTRRAFFFARPCGGRPIRS